MADQKELDKLNQAEEYFNRYFHLKDAVQVTKENKEYLKTYIQTPDYVAKNFNFKGKVTKAVIVSLIAAVIGFLIFFLITGFNIGLIWIPIIIFVLILAGGSIIGYFTNKYQITAALQHQVEINNGIAEQIQMLDDRIKEREKQCKSYYKELGKRVTFISLDYMKYIPKIREILESGEADNCEDAIAVFEQNQLLEEMTNTLNNPVKHTHEEDVARFGNPLDEINAKKKKRKKLFKK